MAKTAKTTQRHLLFGEYYFVELDKPKHTIPKMNLTLMQVSMFQLCFETRNYFE